MDEVAGSNHSNAPSVPSCFRGLYATVVLQAESFNIGQFAGIIRPIISVYLGERAIFTPAPSVALDLFSFGERRTSGAAFAYHCYTRKLRNS